MNLADALATFDKVAVNLEKLEVVWNRAQLYIPKPSFGTVPEYLTLASNWDRSQWKHERVKILMIAESARSTGASYHPTRIGLRDSTHEQA